jgi:hypothetical protein
VGSSIRNVKTWIKSYPGHVVSTLDQNDSWTIKARDVAALRKAVPDKLLVTFARLFAWADRLATVAHMMKLNEDPACVSPESVSVVRNRISLAVFAMGALHEAAIAVAALEQQAVGALVPHSKHWPELAKMPRRWRRRFPDLRNRLAFHADASKIWAGLAHYSRSGEPLIIAQGSGLRYVDGSLQMGQELLLVGMRMSVTRFNRIAHLLAADHGHFNERVEGLFIEVLNAHGVAAGIGP